MRPWFIKKEAEVWRRPEGPAFGVLNPHSPDHSFVLQPNDPKERTLREKAT